MALITSGLLPKALGAPGSGHEPSNEPMTAVAHKLSPKMPLTKKHGMAFGKKNKRLAYTPPEKQ